MARQHIRLAWLADRLVTLERFHPVYWCDWDAFWPQPESSALSGNAAQDESVAVIERVGGQRTSQGTPRADR